ncbi:MAG: HNH endonuclease [Desulfobacterales bacterium]|nr:HNH endonuclease [Desulfobacterales bacterium]
MKPINPDNWTEASCKMCGKKFPILKSRVRRGDGKYCSHKCAGQSRKTRVEVICRACGKEFWETPSRLRDRRGKYCSRQCMAGSKEWRDRLREATPNKFKKGHIPWNKGLTKENNEIMRRISLAVKKNNPCKRPEVRKKISEKAKGRIPWNKSKKWSEEVKRKLRENHADFSGENNPNWKGGYEPYYGPNWEEQRRKALERDHHTCQLCGDPEDGRELDVHHIVPFREFGLERYEEANRLENLITICRSRHSKLHGGSSTNEKSISFLE